MDKIDVDILELLQTNGRISMVELSKEVHMTQPAVKERVKKLEEKGIVTGYQASVSPHSIGKCVSAFILIQSYDCHSFIDFCEQSSEVIDLYRISGQFNYLLKVVTESMETLEEFSDACNKHGNFTTLMVLSNKFENKALLPKTETLD